MPCSTEDVPSMFLSSEITTVDMFEVATPTGASRKPTQLYDISDPTCLVRVLSIAVGLSATSHADQARCGQV